MAVLRICRFAQGLTLCFILASSGLTLTVFELSTVKSSGDIVFEGILRGMFLTKAWAL